MTTIFKYAQGVKGFYQKGQYETFIILEEANTVLIGSGDKADDSGYLGIKRIEEVIDQSRSFGLFIWTLTQKIASMPESIIANSGLVFAGKTGAEKDIDVVMTAIGRDAKRFDVDVYKFFPHMLCFDENRGASTINDLEKAGFPGNTFLMLANISPKQVFETISDSMSDELAEPEAAPKDPMADFVDGKPGTVVSAESVAKDPNATKPVPDQAVVDEEKDILDEADKLDDDKSKKTDILSIVRHKLL